MKLLLATIAALAVAIHGSQHDNCNYECPQFWLPFRGHCYRYFGDRVQWEDALNRCRDHYSRNGRADLASIHNADENGFLYDLFRSSAGDTPSTRPPYYGAWIGLKKPAEGSSSSFSWTDGSSFGSDDFTSWVPNQPDDNADNEDCVHLWRRNADDDILQSWNDLPCSYDQPFICKMVP